MAERRLRRGRDRANPLHTEREIARSLGIQRERSDEDT